jgi:hypothetical protein
MSDEVETLHGNGEIIPEEAMSLMKCIQVHANIGCSICAMLMGFEDIGVDGMNM